jgi:hypothetical protein
MLRLAETKSLRESDELAGKLRFLQWQKKYLDFQLRENKRADSDSKS